MYHHFPGKGKEGLALDAVSHMRASTIAFLDGRVTRRDEPDLGKLIEWVLNIADARHRAWLDGEPEPYGLPVPESIQQIVSPEHGPARFAGPSKQHR